MSPELTGRFFTISTTWEAPPKWKWKSLRGVRLFATPWTIDSPWNSPGQNTRVGRLSLLQGIFPTQGSRPRLPHCRRILYQLSHKGSPRILEWVAYPFSSTSSWPRNQIRVSFIAGGFFTNWATREAPKFISVCSVAQSCQLRPHGLQHVRLPYPSPTPGAYSNSYPSSWWCHPTISSSVSPFSSHLQSFPTLGSFPMSWFFSPGGQSIGVSAPTSVLLKDIWDWFPDFLSTWESLLSTTNHKVQSAYNC